MMNEKENVGRNSAQITISLEQGQLFIHQYNEFMQQYPYPEDVSRTVACHISRKDILAMLSEEANDGIRCYFGKRFNEHQKKDVLCLVMVGTRFENGGYYDIIHDDKERSGIYEFTTPCPDTCDVASPLYQATLTNGDLP